jgi:O-acetyl-ADP-ribose deacetylase (regulator of RNase III)
MACRNTKGDASMRQAKYSCRVGKLGFHLIHGDLFDVDAQAIVNSEQTDFILARDPKSISGQIARRWGAEVQDELDSKTNRRKMPLPTVLETHAGHRIFHAGFHDAEVDQYSWEEETDHLAHIRRCVQFILERAYKSRCPSVAFPLIGTGVFQLSVELVARNFLDCVMNFATEQCAEHEMDVSLVLSNRRFLTPCLEAMLDTMAKRIPLSQPSWKRLAIGVPFLDRFETSVLRETDSRWKAWQLIAYAEWLTIYMFAVISNCHSEPLSPESILDQDRRATFGIYRERAIQVARTIDPKTIIAGASGPRTDDARWISFVAELLKQDGIHGHQRLEAINVDRNKLAHHEAHRPYEELRADLEAFLNLPRWKRMTKQFGKPAPLGASPWMVQAPVEPPQGSDNLEQVGCLERWTEKKYYYLNPNSGRQFEIRRVGN